MKLIIAGTRDLDLEADRLTWFMAGFEFGDVTEIVSGASGLIDQLGEHVAAENSIPVKQFPAQWDVYGKSAGPRRNREMAQYGDALLLVWNGVSRGSQNMRDEMLALGKPVYEVIFRG